LRDAGSPVTERVLKKMIRNQLERTSISPVYDLEYDLQLNAALEALASDAFATLINEAPSVKDLQVITASVSHEPKPGATATP
jgi:carboxyl-terminal processing protease